MRGGNRKEHGYRSGGLEGVRDGKEGEKVS